MERKTSPRGTFSQIAEAVKLQIQADPDMTELPRLADVMHDHGVSRGVALRAFGVLRAEGLAEPVPGSRWRVVRIGQREDRRSLADRIADVITERKLKVGDPAPSASELCTLLGVARPTVRKALDKLQAAGLLSEGGQGKARTVRALPDLEERASS